MRGNIDLFSACQVLPEEVQNAINQFDGDINEYEECKKLEERLKPLGYSFEYHLDGIPYDLIADDPEIQKRHESHAAKILEIDRVREYGYPEMVVEFKMNYLKSKINTMDIVDNLTGLEGYSNKYKIEILTEIQKSIRKEHFKTKDSELCKSIKADGLEVSRHLLRIRSSSIGSIRSKGIW